MLRRMNAVEKSMSVRHSSGQFGVFILNFLGQAETGKDNI